MTNFGVVKYIYVYTCIHITLLYGKACVMQLNWLNIIKYWCFCDDRDWLVYILLITCFVIYIMSVINQTPWSKNQYISNICGVSINEMN